MKISKKISAGVLIISVTGFIYLIIWNNKVSVNKNLKPDIQETLVSDTGDIVKTGVDLTSADYHQFYDELSPHGKWIKVRPEDLGIKQVGNSGSKNGNNSSLINNVLGIQDAYADSYVGWDFFFVWQPSPVLSVGVIAGESSPTYVPYTNGRWVYTEDGWYFKAPTHYEEIVHHYGRWCYNGAYGWVWIPGNVWAPAWVRWAEDDDYIGWTPVETSVYLYNQYYIIQQPEYTFVSVEKKHFLEPEPYRFYKINNLDNDRYDFRKYENHEGPKFKNNVLVNGGPDKRKIENVYGKKINPVNLENLKVAGKTETERKRNGITEKLIKTKTDRKKINEGRNYVNSNKERKVLERNRFKFNNDRERTFKNYGKKEQKEKSYGVKKFTNSEKSIRNKSENRKEDRINQKNSNSKFQKTDLFQNKRESNNRDNGRKKK